MDSDQEKTAGTQRSSRSAQKNSALKKVLWFLLALAVILPLAAFVFLVTFDFNQLKPFIIQNAREHLEVDLAINGDVRVDLGFSPIVRITGLSLPDGLKNTAFRQMDIKQVEVEVELFPLLKKHLRISRIALQKPSLILEPAQVQKTKPPFPPLVAQFLKSWDLSLESLVMEKARIQVVNRPGSIQLPLAFSRLEAHENRQGKLNLKGAGELFHRPFEARGQIGALAAILDINLPFPLELRLETANGKASVSGQIKDILMLRQMVLHVQAQADIGGVLRHLLPDLKDTRPGPAEISLVLADTEAGAWKMDKLSVNLPKNRATGSASLDISRGRPSMAVHLETPTLELQPLLLTLLPSGEERKQKALDLAGMERLFPSNPLPLDWMNALDFQLDYKAEKCLLPGLAIDDLRVAVSLQDGTLLADPIHAGVAGGRLHIRGSLAKDGNKADGKMEMQVKDMDLSRIPAVPGQDRPLEGMLDFAMHMEGAGESVAQVMAGINGDVSTALKDSSIDQSHIDGLVRELSGGLISSSWLDFISGGLGESLLRALNPFSEKSTEAQINCLFSRFEIKDGIAESKALVIDNEDTTIYGAGSVNLATEKLDISVQPIPKKGLGIKNVFRLSLSLGEVANSFKLGGTLTRPEIVLDPKGVAQTTGKTALSVAVFGAGGWALMLVDLNLGKDDPCVKAMNKHVDAVEEYKNRQALEPENQKTENP